MSGGPWGPDGVRPIVPVVVAALCGLVLAVGPADERPGSLAAQRAYAVQVPGGPAATTAATPPPAPTGDLPAPATSSSSDGDAAADTAATGATDLTAGAQPEADPAATAGGDDTSADTIDASTATTDADPGEDDGTPAGDADAPLAKHVFLITLADQPASRTYAAGSPATYLNGTLVPEGVLLPDHHAVTTGGLANQIAMLSGQGPTPETQAGCPVYADHTATGLGDDGQALGTGCVHSSATGTIADQLRANDRDWAAYVEGMAAGARGEPATCRHPVLGTADDTTTVRFGDAYATARNPLVYFHTVIDDAAGCAERDRDLSALAGDLKRPADDVPALTLVTPSPCNDGSDVPCGPGAPAGLGQADAFLRQVVPEIQASAAYADGGLIVITTDAAPALGPATDTSTCCSPPTYPNAAALAPGGGRVGLLLLGEDLAKPGTTVDAPTDHFDLLASLEDLLALPRLGYAARPAVKGIGLDDLLQAAP